MKRTSFPKNFFFPPLFPSGGIRSKNQFFSLFLFIFLFFLKKDLPAPVFITPSTGVKAQGMAGAFVAQGDDLTVLNHNPALLTLLRGTRLQVDGMGFLYHARFLPDSSQGLGEGKEGKNRGDFFRPIPNLFALFSPGERFRIGIGIYSPVGPLYTFEEGGPARYQVVQGEQNLAFLGVGVAYRVDPRWGVALEIQGVFSQASQKQAIGLLPGLRSFDGELFLKLTGTPSFRVKGGFFYNPIPYFYIGGVVISGTDLHLKGDLSVNLPPLGIEDTVPVEVKQRYPSEARIAIGYRDGTYRWEGGIQGFRFREYKEQTLDLKRNHIQGIPFEDQHIRKEFRDTLSFQVGGGYRFFPSIEGRVGYLYEPQSASKRQVSIIEYDADHHLFGIGFSYEQTENLLFHFSYNFVYYLPRTVKGADPALAGILPNPPFIYDGRYERTDQVFGLGMEVGF